MGFNFVTADLDQEFLLPPDMREWLPADHVVFTVLDAVAQFDMSQFEAGYRGDGRGGAAYDPRLMVGLLLFAYCEGVKSSRQIERRCARDVAFRIVSGNRRPDHATIARFRDRHQAALQQVFVQVLRLCAEAGLVRVGLVALDGTKLDADASPLKNYDLARVDHAIARVSEQIQQLVTEAAAQDAAEDRAEVGAADPPVPPVLRERRQRLGALLAAKERLAADAAARQRAQQQRQAAWDEANQAGRARGGRPASKVPDRAQGSGKTNLTDPDSKIMRTKTGFRQSYNGQAVVTRDQIIIAAEIVNGGTDVSFFHPMLDAARESLDAAGIADRIRAVAADAGYSGKANRDHQRPAADDPIPLVDVPPLGGKRSAKAATRPGEHDSGGPAGPDVTPGSGPDRPKTCPTEQSADTSLDRFAADDPRFVKDPSLKRMARRLQNPVGRRLYARRKIMVEPVFGQIKTLNGPRLHHRGHRAVATEWKMMAAAHNLLKYWRSGVAPAS